MQAAPEAKTKTNQAWIWILAGVAVIALVAAFGGTYGPAGQRRLIRLPFCLLVT